MATKTLYIRNSLIGGGNNFVTLEDGGAAGTVGTSGTGWTVGTTALGNYSLMNGGVERAAATFSGTAQPTTAVPNSAAGTAFRTQNPLTGVFAAGNWTFFFGVIAVTAGGDQDGRVNFRVFRGSDPTGAGATEITSAARQGALVTNLTTGAAQGSNDTWAAPEITLVNEYLFVTAAWEITGAGSGSTQDVLLRYNGANNIDTTDFVASYTAAPSAGNRTAVGIEPTTALMWVAGPSAGNRIAAGNTPTVEGFWEIFPSAGNRAAIGNTPTVEGFWEVLPPAGGRIVVGSTPTLDSPAGGLWHTEPAAPILSWGSPASPGGNWGVQPISY